MISVIVPAHNESAVIGRCLHALLRDARHDELEIIVAANGCNDSTESIVENFGPPVRLVRVAEASKPAALNAADRLARGFPRLYVDADVELDTDAVRKISTALQGSMLAASPGLSVDTSRSSHLVRSYYRFWSRLPAVAEDLVGRGVYAVSQEGRQRFVAFPDVTNDDHFFRALFSASERTVVAGCSSRVQAPRTTGSLIARKARISAGNSSMPREGSPWSGIRTVLRRDPKRIVDLPAFLFVGVLSRIRAWRHPGDWGRDDSRDLGAVI